MAALIFYVCGCIDMILSPEDLPTRAKSLTFVRANDEEAFDMLIARVNGYTSFKKEQRHRSLFDRKRVSSAVSAIRPTQSQAGFDECDPEDPLDGADVDDLIAHAEGVIAAEKVREMWERILSGQQRAKARKRIASSIQSHDFFAVPMGINGFYWFCSQPQQNSRRFAVFRFFVHVDDDFNWDHVASCRLFYSELCPFDKDDPTCNCDAHRMYQQVLRYNVHVCNHFCSAGGCAVKLRHTRFTTSPTSTGSQQTSNSFCQSGKRKRRQDDQDKYSGILWNKAELKQKRKRKRGQPVAPKQKSPMKTKGQRVSFVLRVGSLKGRSKFSTVRGLLSRSTVDKRHQFEQRTSSTNRFRMYLSRERVRQP